VHLQQALQSPQHVWIVIQHIYDIPPSHRSKAPTRGSTHSFNSRSDHKVCTPDTAGWILSERTMSRVNRLDIA
jgi:hypothetical protein